MPSQLDLDQGGTFRQTQRVYMGPSIGWIYAPSSVVLPITQAGTTVVQPGNSLVTVNVNAAVTIQLPPAKGNAAGAGGVPGSFVATPLVIVDIGGFATGHPITVQAFGSEKIDGLALVMLQSSFGAFVLQPDVINGGWILTQ